MTARRRHPEQQLQRAVVEYLRIMENLHHLVFFHPANGGGRSRIEAAIFKGLGVRPGVPDLVLLLPDSRAAFIELKADGGRLSASQLAFKKQVEALDFRYAECRSVDEVERFVRGLIAGDGADHHQQGGADRQHQGGGGDARRKRAA